MKTERIRGLAALAAGLIALCGLPGVHTPAPAAAASSWQQTDDTPDQLIFKDGRIMRGALVFNQFKGTGRLINVDDEVSIDFRVDELRDLKF